MGIIKNGWTVLIGEDEAEVRSYLETALLCEGYSVELANDGEEVLDMVREAENPVAAVLLDILMPRKNGLDTLREIRKISASLPVIVISGLSGTLNVVEAMRSGANNFLPKPLTHDDLYRALEDVLKDDVPQAPRQAQPQPDRSLFVRSSSPGMKHIESLIRSVGMSDWPVLIQGETGVGKEVLARSLHAQSQRAKRPFLKLNCAALPSELVESELFGYERGAFTGAFQRKPGMFEMADTGTILLDEIGDMDVKLQAKLLQVLQDGEFQRLGGKDIVRVNVRVLAATHRDLEQAIETGHFREDLYYRLNVIKLNVPPLRERKEDILAIAASLFARHTPQGAPVPQLSARLREAMLRYDWPGNVRELENVTRRFIILRDPELMIAELDSKAASRSLKQFNAAQEPSALKTRGTSAVLDQVREANENAERSAILAAMNSTRWNRKQAAAMLNIDYKALLYKMKKLQIDRSAEAPATPKAKGMGSSGA